MATGRSLALTLGLAVVVGLAACGSSGGTVSDSKIVAALNMRKVQGNYAIFGNPFCSVQKILTDVNEVRDASSSHRVIASRDHSVGVEVIKPFAPRCQRIAQERLDRLASGHRKHHPRGTRGTQGGNGGAKSAAAGKKGGGSGG
jgi:hypothetical protein